MGELGASDAQFVEEKGRNFQPERGVSNEPKKTLCGNRAFIALLKDGLNGMLLREPADDSGDVVLGLK